MLQYQQIATACTQLCESIDCENVVNDSLAEDDNDISNYDSEPKS